MAFTCRSVVPMTIKKKMSNQKFRELVGKNKTYSRYCDKTSRRRFFLFRPPNVCLSSLSHHPPIKDDVPTVRHSYSRFRVAVSNDVVFKFTNQIISRCSDVMTSRRPVCPPIRCQRSSRKTEFVRV